MKTNITNIIKLRKRTKASIMNCKEALIESENNFDKAIEIIRKKGQDIVIKRSDRETSEGCVLAKSTGKYAAIITLKCETDFIAKNTNFVALAKAILNAAITNKCQTIEEIKTLTIDNNTIANAIIKYSNTTGEKIELDNYLFVSGNYTAIYNHQNKNQLCTIVAFNKSCNPQVAHKICMQIAAMNPIAIDEAGIPEDIKQKEISIIIEKTKNKNLVNEHLNNFLKESCLLNQESTTNPGKTINDLLKETDTELEIIDFKRFTLRSE